jgi:predicted RecA/RadA family phage recombinase
MQNYRQSGDFLTLPAPTGGTVSGRAYLIGAVVLVAQEAKAQTLPCVFLRQGVVEHAKTSAQAWAVGATLYWDDTNKVFTTTATSNTSAGFAAEAASNPSATGLVCLHGVPSPAGSWV